VTTTIHDLLPLHAQALLAVERLVAELQIGDRLPSERELSQRLGVSREPIRRAVQQLRDGGVLEARQGSGTWVRSRLRSRTGLVGMSVPTIAWPSIAQLVSGAEAAARVAGNHLVLMHDHGSPALQEEQIASCATLQVDGIIIFPDRELPTRTTCAELLTSLAVRGVNTVLVDRSVPGVPIPCIATDVARGMQDVVAHIAACGYRRLAVLSWGDEAGLAEWNRWSGLRAGLSAHGLQAPIRQVALGYDGDFTADARAVVAGWLADCDGRPDFDVIVTFFDPMALGAWFALRDAGLTQCVALTGFDDTAPELYQAHGLALTTVAQPFADIGRVAVDSVVAAARGQPIEGNVLLPPCLVPRSSTRRS
jgi:LacI family transcriptional regulator